MKQSIRQALESKCGSSGEGAGLADTLPVELNRGAGLRRKYKTLKEELLAAVDRKRVTGRRDNGQLPYCIRGMTKQ